MTTLLIIAAAILITGIVIGRASKKTKVTYITRVKKNKAATRNPYPKGHPMYDLFQSIEQF